jgi:hypothetical protein
MPLLPMYAFVAGTETMYCWPIKPQTKSSRHLVMQTHSNRLWQADSTSYWDGINSLKEMNAYNLTVISINNIVYSWFQTFAVFWMLYVFFRVIPRRLNFICRRFGTLCVPPSYAGRCRMTSFYAYLPMKIEQSVPKRRHIKFRRRGITQKKTYNLFYTDYN